MAKPKVRQNKGQNQPSAEAPVTDEIKAAARRMGLPVPTNAGQASTIASIDQAKRLGVVTLTFTVDELCNAVGHNVNPDSFAADALERIAEQVDAEAIACENEANRWVELQSIVQRAAFAALVVRKLNAEVTS